MRIIYLITRMSEWGGAQVHVRDLAIRLTELGHEIHVISGDEGVISTVLRQSGVTVHIVPEIRRTISVHRDSMALWKLYKLLGQIKPDLLSCHSSKAGILGRVAARLAGVPVLFTAHGYAFTDTSSRLKSTFYKALECAMRFCSDFIITVSEYDRKNALDAHLIAPQLIRTVHNGMPDLAPATVTAKDNTSTCHIIMVARFAAQKDHASLLQGLAILRDLDWRLTLIGGGNAESTHALIHILGLQNRVEILGQRGDVAEWLARSDVFVLTTHWEGFPRSIVEAMRAGLPVVATNVAGVPEAVAEGATGYLLPPRDVVAVSEKLRLLIESPTKRLEMGAAGRARFLSEFTFEHMFEKTMAVYQEVLAAHQRKSH